MVEVVSPAVTCWRCGYGFRTFDGFCRQCFSDWDSPAREPTPAEAGPWGRFEARAPTFEGVNRSLAIYAKRRRRY